MLTLNKPKFIKYFESYLLILFSILTVFLTGYYSGKKEREYIYVTKDTCYNSIDSLNIINLLYEINKNDIKYPEIVLSQSILETGYFKSNVCKTKNNIFGFYYKNEYMNFKTWKDCVYYYKKWQDKYYKSGNYYDFLDNIGYAEDPNYSDKLLILVNKYEIYNRI